MVRLTLCGGGAVFVVLPAGQLFLTVIGAAAGGPDKLCTDVAATGAIEVAPIPPALKVGPCSLLCPKKLCCWVNIA